MTVRCPCKGCDPPKRHLRCHSNCGEYLDWQKQELEKKQKMRNENMGIQSESLKRLLWKRMRWR